MGNLLNTTGYPIFCTNMVKGSGCYVYDADEKRYLDLESGVWALPLGHQDKDVIRAMEEQMGIMIHTGYKYSHPITEQCAGKILSIAGKPKGKCVFLSSGSEAVEYGLQLAKRLHPGKKGLCLSGQFFSSYGQCIKEQEWKKIDWDYHKEKSVSEYEEELRNSVDFQTIGVFLLDAGNTSGLVKLPSKNLVTAIAKLAKEYGIITMADEVTCGMGRTGKWFGYMHYEIEPDIIAAGKGLGNGYPVSVVIMESEIAEGAIEKKFHYGQSHQNDPMGCAVAYAVIKKLEQEHLLWNAAAMGTYLMDGYRGLQKKYSFIKEVRGIGLLDCIEFGSDISEETLEKLEHKLFEQGIIAAVKVKEHVLRTYCPLIITKDMLDEYIHILDKVLSEITLPNITIQNVSAE